MTEVTNPLDKDGVSDELRRAFWACVEVTREGTILGLDKGLLAFAAAWNRRSAHATVTEEMVEGAIDAYHAEAGESADWYGVIAAIKFALSVRAEPVAVKPLVWEGSEGQGGGFVYNIAEPDRTVGWRVWGKMTGLGSVVASVGGVIVTMKAKDREAAIAAAQADYEQRIRSALVKAPAPAESPEAVLSSDILAELTRARAKFPGKNVTFAALVEEVGELATATFEEGSDRVRKEAVQVAVMAMRMVLDGDHTFDAWRQEKGLDPLSSPSQPQAGDGE